MRYLIPALFLFFMSINAFGQNNSTDEEPVSFAEEMPTLNGGVNVFIEANLKYPEQAKKSKISGVVYIQFTVEKTGCLENIKVLKGLGYGCDEEALRIINSMPQWNPAKVNGRPVSMKLKIPIKFKLPE